MEEQTQSAPTQLCRMGCGFFGSSATEGMCSQCFSEYQHRKQEQSTKKSTTSNSSQNANQLLNSHHITNGGSNDGGSGALEERDFSEACMHMIGGNVQATPLSDLPASPQALPTLQQDTNLHKTPKKNRCFMCRKKLGLTGFHCRCGEQFCSFHRYADQHSCSFDYKTSGREELERKHPRVVASKIQKL